MGFGGLCPFPLRFGGAAGRNLKALTDSIAKARGTAYDTASASIVWTECAADARAVAMIWEASRRMANQVSAQKMTSFLERWESILGIVVPRGSSRSDRRTVIETRMSLISRPATLTGVRDLVRAMLPNTFVDIVHTSSPLAMDVIPITVIGGVTVGAPPGTKTMAGPHGVVEPGFWSGSTHHLAIEVVQPATMSDADFYTEVGSINNGVLRRFLPAWVTFSTFRDGTTPAGFWLDDPHNLDNERLGVTAWGCFAPAGPAFAQSVLPVMFSLSATAPTYCMWYGFTLAALTVTTLTITAGTLPSCRGAIFQYATEPSATPTWTFTGGASANFPGPYPAGNYIVEVSANATSTIGVSPGSFTIGLS